jgi:hypothetical protein
VSAPDSLYIGNDNGGELADIVGWVVMGIRLEPVISRADGEQMTLSEFIDRHGYGAATNLGVWTDDDREIPHG